MRNDIATPDRFLSVNDTIAMKAIAILLMLMHHLWAFPDRIAGGPLESILQFSNFPLTVHIGVFGKICVSIFFFLGGYGLYKKYFGKRYNLAERLKKLYFAYWKIFVIFVPIGFIFFSNQNAYCADAGVYSAFSSFSIKEFLLNVTGIESTYNKEWWFLINYAIALVLFPLIRKIVDRFSVGVNISIVVLVTILLTDIFPYAACFWMGAIVAKHSLFDKLSKFIPQNKGWSTIIDISVWLFVIVLRQ